MLPRFETPEDFEKYLKENYYFLGNVYLNVLHAWMGVFIHWFKYNFCQDFEYFKDFFNRFLPETEQEKELFIHALYEAMRLWAYELRKVKNFKLALRTLIDDRNKHRHKFAEERFFYDFFDEELDKEENFSKKEV
jgi:hypothetical protein